MDALICHEGGLPSVGPTLSSLSHAPVNCLCRSVHCWWDAHQQAGQKQRYNDTLENALRRLHINPEICEDLVQHRPIWRRVVKTGATNYEANRIVATKTKRLVHKSQAPRIHSANIQPLPTCSCYQRTRTRLAGHPRTPYNNNQATSSPPSTNTPTVTPASNLTTTTTTTTKTIATADLPPPSIACTILPTPTLASITATSTTTSPTPTTDETASDVPSTTTFVTGLDSNLSALRPRIHLIHRPGLPLAGPSPCDRTPVLGAPTYTRRTYLHCSNCLSPFGHTAISTSQTQLAYPKTFPYPALRIHHPPVRPQLIASSPTDSTAPNLPPALTATTQAYHASVWSASCKPIARRLTRRFQEHQHTAIAPASISHTVYAHSLTAWAYLVTCDYMQTYGKSPQTRLHHHTLLHQHMNHAYIPPKSHTTDTSHVSGSVLFGSFLPVVHLLHKRSERSIPPV
ncbi:hypothetical protein SprV_0100080000 [Sparganum proliferum]